MTSDASWVESMPEIYDRCVGPAVFVPWAARVAAATAALSPARVLELAAGTGILTAALVDAMPSAEIVATDLNSAVVSYAAARVPGATYAVADAQTLDYSDSAFDVVVCHVVVPVDPPDFGVRVPHGYQDITLIKGVWRQAG